MASAIPQSFSRWSFTSQKSPIICPHNVVGRFRIAVQFSFVLARLLLRIGLAQMKVTSKVRSYIIWSLFSRVLAVEAEQVQEKGELHFCSSLYYLTDFLDSDWFLLRLQSRNGLNLLFYSRVLFNQSNSEADKFMKQFYFLLRVTYLARSTLGSIMKCVQLDCIVF